MGYVAPEQPVYRLQFTGAYQGLEVRVRAGSMADCVSPGRLATHQDSAAVTDHVDDIVTRFAASLLSWNVEDTDGRPVPATADGVSAQHPEFVWTIIRAWIDLVASQFDNRVRHGDDSDDSDSDLIASLPVEALVG